MSNNGETVIGDTVRFNEDPDFSAGLNRIGTFYAVIVICDLFKFGQPVDIILQILASGTGSGCRDSISALNYTCNQRCGLHITMMRLNGVYDDR